MFVTEKNNYDYMTHCKYTLEKKNVTIQYRLVQVIFLLVLYVNDLKQRNQAKQVSKLDIVHFFFIKQPLPIFHTAKLIIE